MRLGPLEIGLRDRQLRPALGEMGATGTQIFGGLMQQQDYNTDLAAPQLYNVYDKMRRADGQVKSALRVIKLPLLSVAWTVRPASQDERDRQIADFIERDLMRMTISWDSYLYQALLHLDFGTMPFEKVWEIRDDGFVHLRKLAPRMPKTIVKWYTDETGGLAGIQQGAQHASGYKLVDIPVEKLLVFVNDQEGSDFRGVSVLRAAYKHWYFKDKLYIVDAIAKERRALGVDVGTLKGVAKTTDRKQALEQALMTLHAHEKQYMVEIDEEVAYRVEGLRGAVLDAMPSIEHHDLQILRSVLAEFLAMGQGATGSLAMHRDKSAFFIMALRAVANHIAWTMNTYLIRSWVDYNWEVDSYPVLEHSRLETRDVQLLAEAIEKFVGAGALTPDLSIEEQVRSALDLPPPPEREQEEIAKSRVFASRKKWNEIIDFARMEAKLDEAETTMLAAVRQVQRRHVERILPLAQAAIERGDVEAIDQIGIPYRSEIAAAFFSILEGLYDQGRAEANSELAAQGMSLEMAALPLAVQAIQAHIAYLRSRARVAANLLGDRIKSALTWESLRQIREGEYDRGRLGETLSSLSEREVRKIIGISASESLSLGRQSVGQQHKERIQSVQYSAKMDSRTCGPCSVAHGHQFNLDDPQVDNYRTPYASCDGRDRCRCIWIYRLSEVPIARRMAQQ